MFINQNKKKPHSYFMQLALGQAKKNLGNTRENPSVGCVVTKNNSVISIGCTSINGRPHAEQKALNLSKSKLKSSELYVTLEPCSHYGKTPPCTKLIIKKGVKKVFFSVNDPDKRSFNKSIYLLKKNKILVNKGNSENKLKYFYRSYIKYKTTPFPFVTCKIAVSNDFFTVNKKKEWITNGYSRSRVHLMRSYHDCIITSSQTIIKDNSKLNCRINGLRQRSPVKIILDNNLKIPINANVLNKKNKNRTIIFYNNFNKLKIKRLKNLGVKIYKVSLDSDKNLDLKEILTKLRKLGFQRVFVESGIKLTTNFLYNNLVDDFKLFISNKNLGKNGMYNIKKSLNKFLKNKKTIFDKVNLFGDKLITYKIK